MAWVKIDDRFDEHPKWDNAPGDSIALWVAAMAWCNRNDSHTGFIPHTKTLGLVNVRSHKATIADLLKRGVFHRHEGGYVIHDYEEYQQNEKVKAIRAKRSAAGKLGARARWADSNGMANAIDLPSDSVANAWQTDGNENAPRPDDPIPTGSTEDDDDLQSAEPSSVVNGQHLRRAIERLAELLWPDAQVRYSIPAKTRNAWLNGTTKNLWNERRHELEALLTEGLTPEQAAEHAHCPPEPERHLSVVRATCDNPECVNGLIPDDPASDTPLWARCPSCNSLGVAQ